MAFIINCSFCINGVIRKKMWKISREHSKLNEKKPGTPRQKIRKTIKRQIIPLKHYIEHYVSTPPKTWVISGAMEEKVDSAPLVGPVMLLRVNTDLVTRLFPSYQNWGKEDMIVVMTFETYWWSSMTLATLILKVFEFFSDFVNQKIHCSYTLLILSKSIWIEKNVEEMVNYFV